RANIPSSISAAARSGASAGTTSARDPSLPSIWPRPTTSTQARIFGVSREAPSKRASTTNSMTPRWGGFATDGANSYSLGNLTGRRRERQPFAAGALGFRRSALPAAARAPLARARRLAAARRSASAVVLHFRTTGALRAVALGTGTI